jgi:4-hydroxy-3-methylbut-2-enyl diphosphate reductase IspH
MKRAAIVLTAAMVFCYGVASACSIRDRKETQIGNDRTIEGVCSNNGLPISCMVAAGEGITCDGPEGGYNGYDLNALIYPACGCSLEQEQLQEEKKDI